MDSHSEQPWHPLPPEDALNTSGEGLIDAEAEQRLRANGRELRRKPPKSCTQGGRHEP